MSNKTNTDETTFPILKNSMGFENNLSQFGIAITNYINGLSSNSNNQNNRNLTDAMNLLIATISSLHQSFSYHTHIVPQQKYVAYSQETKEVVQAIVNFIRNNNGSPYFWGMIGGNTHKVTLTPQNIEVACSFIETFIGSGKEIKE